MSRTREILLYGIGALVGLGVFAAAALFVFGERLVPKSSVEAAVSRALGLEVSIAGPLAVEVLPALRLTLEDVHVRKAQAEILSARQAVVGVELRSLFGPELRIRKIELEQPTIDIARHHDGHFNFETMPASAEPVAALDGPELTLTGATVTYADERFGKPFSARDCRVDVHGLRHPGGPRASLFRAVSFTADLRCGELRRDTVSMTDVSLAAVAGNGVLELEPVVASLYGARGSGSVRADFTRTVPTYRITGALAQFPVETFLKANALEPVATGRLDFVAQFSTQGRTAGELRQALAGTASLRGKGLVFNGADLDRRFARFESSQRLDLVDVGALFLAGPLGLLVTKGYDFAALSQDTAGHSEIRALVSDWKVERGVARAQDVAMLTQENRIAVHGGLDFVKRRFDDITIALVDARGCAVVRQGISGSFDDPLVERPSVLASLAGPAIRLLKKGRDLILGDNCDPFYAGSLAAPR